MNSAAVLPNTTFATNVGFIPSTKPCVYLGITASTSVASITWMWKRCPSTSSMVHRYKSRVLIQLRQLRVLLSFLTAQRAAVSRDRRYASNTYQPRPFRVWVEETNSPTKLPTTTLLLIFTGMRLESAVTQSWSLASLLFSKTPPTCFSSGSISQVS